MTTADIDTLRVSQRHYLVVVREGAAYAQGQINSLVPKGSISLYGLINGERLTLVENVMTDWDWHSVQDQCVAEEEWAQ